MKRFFFVFILSFVFPSLFAEDKIIMPEFPGGVSELKKYLKENIIYPTAARQMEIAGEVVVEFTVERSGALTGFNVVKSLSPELDQEALRVVRGMPDWKCGTKNGVPARVTMTLPINFKLHKVVGGYLNQSDEITSKRFHRRVRHVKKNSTGTVRQ